MSKRERRPAELRCAALVLATLFYCTGCVRFGYDEVERHVSSMRDAGADMDAAAAPERADAGSALDAQPRAAGGSAGSAETGAGTGGSAAGTGSGPPPAVDAGLDAGVSSAAPDASAVDAATPAADSGSDASTFPFANCMQATGVVFCNGFEEPLPWVPNPWDDHTLTNGSEERATGTKYAGDASAHMSTMNNTSDTSARLAYNRLGGLTSGDIWLRYYYYLPSTVMIDSYFTAAVLSELTSPYAGVSLLIRPGQLQIKSASIANKSVGFTFPRDRWVCLEHHVFVSASAGFFEIFIDGASTLKSVTGNSIPGAGWGSAQVGIHDVGSNQSPVEVYVDNVVVSTSRYGCD